VKKLFYILSIILLHSCNSKPDYKEIIINKTIKVISSKYQNESENYTFKWDPPMNPKNELVPFDLKNNMLIFTPNVEGKYHIYLSITDISDEIVAQEEFYYFALPDTNNNSIIELNVNEVPAKKKVNSKTKIDKKVKKSKKSEKDPDKTNYKKNNLKYAIQVSAWPTMQEARISQIELTNEGIDAYIEKFYRKKIDQVWYRVRVGNFSEKNRALSIKTQIETLTGNKTWLTITEK